MNKEEAYEIATMQELGGNQNGTRQDVVWRAMDIYAKDIAIRFLRWRHEPAKVDAEKDFDIFSFYELGGATQQKNQTVDDLKEK